MTPAQRRAARKVIDAAIVAVPLAYGIYLWASWVDPTHRAYDTARAWWHVSRTCAGLAAVLGRAGMLAEIRAREAVS